MSTISRKLLSPRVQELGKVKLGGKGPEVESAGGKKFQRPVKFQHFVVTTRERGPDGNFLRDEHLHHHVGDEPTELEGVLMFETPEENFHSEMVVYEGRTKVWSCNGEEATNLKNGKVGTCPRLSDKPCKCKPYARLHLQLLHSPLEGYHVFRTTSWESTNNIQTVLERLHGHFGTLLGLPVKLVCYPATVSYEANGKSRTSKAMMAGLVLAASFEEVSQSLLARNQVLQATKAQVKQLAAKVESSLAEADEAEAEDIALEYFPDESGEASVRTKQTLEAMKDDLGVESTGPKVIEGDYEIEDDDEGEGEDDSPSTAVTDLRALVEKAREAGAMDLELEALAEDAMESGAKGEITEAKKRVSAALVKAEKAKEDSDG